jgi:hypothetical protein
MAERRKLPPHYFLGLRLSERGRETGLRIAAVARRSPVETAKLREGDVLVEIGGREVASVADVRTRLRRTNRIAVRRDGRKLTRQCRAVNLSDAREALTLAFGDPRKWYTSDWKTGRKCRKGKCVDGSMWSMCRTYYTYEGEGAKGGVKLQLHCQEHNVDTKNDYDEKDPTGPVEYF